MVYEDYEPQLEEKWDYQSGFRCLVSAFLGDVMSERYDQGPFNTNQLWILKQFASLYGINEHEFQFT